MHLCVYLTLYTIIRYVLSLLFPVGFSFFQVVFRRRPYRVEYTGSLPTSEVKRHRARLVLGWGTAWEHPRVLSAFCIRAVYVGL
jgi:hypothetical protein